MLEESVSDQAHQQLKEELGLDHFERRSWQSLHRHALMTMIAYAFLQHRRLTKVRREKKSHRTTTSTQPASRAPSHHRSHRSIAVSSMPALPTMDRPDQVQKCHPPDGGIPLLSAVRFLTVSIAWQLASMRLCSSQMRRAVTLTLENR